MPDEQKPTAATATNPATITPAAATTPPAPPKPSIGRIVHYVLPETSPHKGQHRPAIITQNFGGDACNLAVQKGQPNDFSGGGCTGHVESQAVALVTSALLDPHGAFGTWHWPEPV